MNIDQLNTPCLVLNEEKLSNNIERIRNRLDEKALIFRPHMKTAKCIEVGRRMMKSPQGPIAVSTLKEAEKFAEAGVLDILYAVGIAPSKLEAVSALRSRGIDLSIVIDSVSQAEAVAARARLDRDPIPVLIEIDADGSRGGVRFDASEKVLTIARELHAGGAELRGVLTYSGATYECRDVDEIRAVAERERQAAVHSAGLFCGTQVSLAPSSASARRRPPASRKTLPTSPKCGPEFSPFPILSWRGSVFVRSTTLP